jgi:hypothetical protein
MEKSMRYQHVRLCAFAAALLCSASIASAAPLRAGSAKVEVTPAKSSLGPTDVIRDALYARTIVVSDGKDCAVLVGVDVGGLSTSSADQIRTTAARETGCARDNIVISATHTHSGVISRFSPPAGLEEKIVSSIRQAYKSLRPARLGYGTAQIALNVNRDLFKGGKWYQGINREGPSDKTLSTLFLIGADGRPIGVYLNYAMHPIDFYLSGVISADYAGEASGYIENAFGDQTVAVFAQGASGDQNPLLMGPGFALMGERVGVPAMTTHDTTAPFSWEVLAAETNANARFVAALDQPLPPERRQVRDRAAQDTGRMVAAMGALIGESAIDIMRNDAGRLAPEGTIWGGVKEVVCPGRDRKDQTAREGVLPEYKDASPVKLSVGLVRIGDVYVSTVNGEVYNEIATRLKREAPAHKLMMTTLANGMAGSGYIYSNRASPYLTFQVIGSRLKPGCAEDAIVDASLDLIEQAGAKK